MKVVLSAYDPSWPAQYLVEEAKVRQALEPLNISIDHVGSTSVEGLGAKPKIDILVGLETAEDLDRTVPLMIGAGYTYFKVYEPWLPYRRMFARLHSGGKDAVPKIIDIGEPFVDGSPFTSSVHIHIIERHSYHWKRHIAFRDYLRENAEVREQYDALKKLLAEKEFVDGNDYNRHKANFIAEVEKKAMEWKEKNGYL